MQASGEAVFRDEDLGETGALDLLLLALHLRLSSSLYRLGPSLAALTMVDSDGVMASEATPRPNAAALAFADGEIASRICAILAAWIAEQDFPRPGDDVRAKYWTFSTLSRVTRAFRKPAQEHLNSDLVFSNGRQVRQWLDTLGDQPSKYRTYRVYLHDPLPFKLDGPESKWDLTDLRQLFDSVRGVSVVFLCFACQHNLPAELLSSKHLKGAGWSRLSVANFEPRSLEHADTWCTSWRQDSLS